MSGEKAKHENTCLECMPRVLADLDHIYAWGALGRCVPSRSQRSRGSRSSLAERHRAPRPAAVAGPGRAGGVH